MASRHSLHLHWQRGLLRPRSPSHCGKWCKQSGQKCRRVKTGWQLEPKNATGSEPCQLGVPRRAMLQALPVVIEKSPSDVDSQKGEAVLFSWKGSCTCRSHTPLHDTHSGSRPVGFSSGASLGLFRSGFIETGNGGINSKQGVTLHFLSAISHRMSHKHFSGISCD